MIVYWAAYTEFGTVSQFKFQEPYPVWKRVNETYRDLPPKENFKMCPATQDFYKNVFELQFPCTYHLNISRENGGTRLTSPDYDQKFFDEMVMFRSTAHGLYSYNVRYIFFCEQSLEVSMEPAYFSNSDFVAKTMLLAGKFNIGQWFRPFDCAFVIRHGVENISLAEADPFAYLRFHTVEPIEFKRFNRSESIKQLHLELFGIRNHRLQKIYPLSYFYKMYEQIKIKKLLAREIRSNLMD
jgi:hypothetical protein